MNSIEQWRELLDRFQPELHFMSIVSPHFLHTGKTCDLPKLALKSSAVSIELVKSWDTDRITGGKRGSASSGKFPPSQKRKALRGFPVNSRSGGSSKCVGKVFVPELCLGMSLLAI